MTTTQKFNPETRKALAKALAEILETKSTYLGVPSCAYQVGGYHLAKNGELTGPALSGLLAALHERGFDPEIQEADDTAPAEAAPAKLDKSGLPSLYTLLTPRGEIYITEEFATRDEAAAEGYGEAFSTALGTVYSYGDNHTFALVTEHKAGDWDTTTMGRDFRAAAPAEEAPKRRGIMDCLVEALNEEAGDGEKWERLHRQPTIIDNSGREHNLDGTFAAQTDFPTAPEFDQVVIEMPLTGFTPAALDNLCKMVTAKEELIKLAIGADTLPIQVLEDRIAFPWLRTADPELVDALATFIAALCKTAREKKRVTATPQPTGVNDRYRFRCFMLHIGMIGPEYAAARTKLIAPLSGNSGWLNGPPEKAEPAPEAEAPAEEAPEAEEAPAPAPEETPAADETVTESETAGDAPGDDETADA